MLKNFAKWRQEAESINASAQAKGEPAPIPDASKLRKEPLAKKVIEHRINNHLDGGQS
jgi:hypothetical protein